MRFLTKTQLITEVLTSVGLVTGTGVQTYTEPQIEQHIQQTFDMLIKQHTFEHLCKMETFILDGTTGVVTADLTTKLDNFAQIIAIHISGQRNSQLCLGRNNQHLSLTGSTPKLFREKNWLDSDYAAKLFTVYPLSASGSIDVHYKVLVDDFEDDDVVPLDRWLMVYGVTWNLLEVDGLNPPAAAKAKALFELTFKNTITENDSHPIG